MNIHLNAAVGGRFKFEVYKADTGEKTKEIDWFDNLVLDSGLIAMRTCDYSYFESVQLGTGTSVPHVSQTHLDNAVAFANCGRYSAADVVSMTRGNVPAEGYYFTRQKVRFPAGKLNNTQAISEVGLGYLGSGKALNNPLWNRALLKDENGNPRTLTVNSDEYLDVTFEIRCYVNTSDIVANDFVVKDRYDNVMSTHETIVRPNFHGSLYVGSKIHNFTCEAKTNYTLPELTENGRGSYRWYASNVTTGRAYNSQVNPTSITYWVSVNLTTGNGGIGMLWCQTDLGDFYVQINPIFNKTSNHTLVIYFTLNWGRYTPPANNQP